MFVDADTLCLKKCFFKVVMASADSFILILKQVDGDLNVINKNIKKLLTLVGAWYTLRLTIKFGSYILRNFIGIAKLLPNRNLVKTYGSWAVITGCTSGIGNAFASALASKGLNIVLISRNDEALSKQARHIQKNFGVHTITLVYDFSNTSFASLNTIKNTLESLDVGILINNVGIHYDYPMEFHLLDENRIDSLLQVNMSSAVTLSRLVLPGMVDRQRGLIVNMSSAAGAYPYPLISLYSATKAFLNHFSQSLHEEVKHYNVHVQSLVPYYIGTKMVAYSSLLQSSVVFTPSPEAYANSAVQTFGLFRVNTGYFPHTIQGWMLRRLPKGLTLRVGYWLHCHLNKEGTRTFS